MVMEFMEREKERGLYRERGRREWKRKNLPVNIHIDGLKIFLLFDQQSYLKKSSHIVVMEFMDRERERTVSREKEG